MFVTRRQLLRSLGAAGGAGVMFEAMRALGFAGTAEAADYQAPKRSDFGTTGRVAPRVVILGAGIAGLATADELGKAGSSSPPTVPRSHRASGCSPHPATRPAIRAWSSPTQRAPRGC